MSDRFLDFLKKSNANRYKALIKEIEQCKKDLNYVEEFNDDDDEILCDALDNSKNEPVKRKQNDSSNISSKRRKEDSEENTTTNRNKYICNCGKSYNHRQSLHRHKKKCQEKSEPTENEIQQIIQERNVSMSSPAIETLVPPTASSTSVGTLVPPTASLDLDVCMEDAIEESRQPEPTPFQNSNETITSDRRMQQPVGINGGFTCRHCEIPFDSFSALVDHIEVNHPMSQSGHGNAPSSINIIGSNDQNSTDLGDVVSAIDDQVEKVTINPSSEDERYDLLNFFAKSRENIKDILQARRQQLGNMKVYLNSRVEMTRDLDEGDKTTVPHFRSKTFTLFESDEPEDDLNSAFQEMADSMENFINEGSDWRMEEVVCMEVVTVPFEPLNGSSYLPLPPGYDKIRSVVNIKSRDNRCFLWSVLAALHPQPNSSRKSCSLLRLRK